MSRMSLNDWQNLGHTHATEGKPYNPPAFGLIMEAYTEGYDQATEGATS